MIIISISHWLVNIWRIWVNRHKIVYCVTDSLLLGRFHQMTNYIKMSTKLFSLIFVTFILFSAIWFRLCSLVLNYFGLVLDIALIRFFNRMLTVWLARVHIVEQTHLCHISSFRYKNYWISNDCKEGRIISRFFPFLLFRMAFW
jgi:hypothetical protein